jgi:hypothetical protein
MAQPQRICILQNIRSNFASMAAEPINIFSHKRDLVGIVTLLRQMSQNVQVIGSDDAWERIIVQGAKNWLRKAPTLVFKNSPEYYGGPSWPQQLAGMQGYIGRFPDTARKPEILRMIPSFRFALATEFDPDLFLESNDPRLKLLFGVARHLDGALFTPSGLWDSAGRALLCVDGRTDVAAVLPALSPVEAEVHVIPKQRSEGRIEEGITPPDAPRVMRRALSLAAVSGRGFLEIEKMAHDQAEEERKRILTWAGELALENELEQEELKLLQEPVGSLPQQSVINAVWRLEGLAVLAWALARLELPVYDQVVGAGALLPALGFLDLNRATELLASPRLRRQEELRTLQNQYFALHWRLRNFSLDKKRLDFRKFARECWFGPLDLSSARFCEDDLAIGEVPIRKARLEAFQKTLSIANERHLAVNWLAHGGELYSNTDTST